MEEDLLIRFFRDPQTNEFLIAGAGQPHIEAIVSRLKKRYHAEVTLKAPKVPYREPFAPGRGAGRHKKQTGGHGQFGDCKIRMEPMPRGAGFEFASEVFGGAIPRNFIPAIEKASSSRPPAAISPAIRSSTSGPSSTTAPITTFDSNEMSLRWPAAWPSARPWKRPSPAFSNHHEGRNRSPRRVRRNINGRPSTAAVAA